MIEYNPRDYHILLVDDDQLVLDGLTILLEDNYNLVTVTSGLEAIKAVEADSSIAVVVMDIKMPGIDGIDTARRLKEIKTALPIVFHTGFSGEYDEDLIDAQETPYQYVQKGSSPTQLTRAVRNGL